MKAICREPFGDRAHATLTVPAESTSKTGANPPSLPDDRIVGRLKFFFERTKYACLGPPVSSSYTTYARVALVFDTAICGNKAPSPLIRLFERLRVRGILSQLAPPSDDWVKSI